MDENSSLFWQLVEREHGKARAHCRWLAGNSEDGDELYQDSVIKAFDGFAGLRKVDSFRPWFYRIVSNTYRSRARSTWWKRIVRQSSETEECAWSSNPADAYEAKRRLDYALAALSVDDRIIVALAELEGWKISEVAELTAKTEGFVKMRLSRARQKMREKLARHYRQATRKMQSKGTEKICCATRPDKD